MAITSFFSSGDARYTVYYSKKTRFDKVNGQKEVEDMSFELSGNLLCKIVNECSFLIWQAEMLIASSITRLKR